MGRICLPINNPKHTIDIALVGKYVELKDSYKSISESFIHASSYSRCKVNLHWICSEKLDAPSNRIFKEYGWCFGSSCFGPRGIEGKLYAVQYARENKIPFFGFI